MDSKLRLTKENQKSLGVPLPIHRVAMELAGRDGVPVWKIIARALDLYQRVYGNGHEQED